MGALQELAITELGLALLGIWIVVYNTLQYIYLCAFFDSTDLLESGGVFFINIAKMQPYILHDSVLDPICFIVACGYFVSSGGGE